MKKLIALCAFICLLTGCSSSASSTDYVDAYTSASLPKVTLEGSDLEKVKTAMSGVCSDLASLAETKAEGYVFPKEINVQILSVNPDGTPGLSTIHAWKITPEKNTIEVELMDGQNAQNLGEVGDRGSMLVKMDNVYYMIHLNVTDVAIMEYSEEAFNEGKFNSMYSGQANAQSQYHITMEILAIEKCPDMLFQ